MDKNIFSIAIKKRKIHSKKNKNKNKAKQDILTIAPIIQSTYHTEHWPDGMLTG